MAENTTNTLSSLDAATKGSLPSDFHWGYATSAAQIEGAWDTHGKGHSIWDTFGHTPGRIRDSSTADDACASYARSKQDVELLKQYGATAYRFSLSHRVLQLLIDLLLENGITPFVTLFHWDLPESLYRRYGGMLDKARYTADFVRYARLCFDRFGDRVKWWVTYNEPGVVARAGYGEGRHAPGHVSASEPFVVAHTQLVSHGYVCDVYKREYQPTQKGLIMMTLDGNWSEPWDAEDPADVEAAQRAIEFEIAWFADPLYERYDSQGEHGFRPQTRADILEDTFRVEYYRSYITEVAKAVQEEVVIKSYFAWSFLDNWEWAIGYTARFGVTWVDFNDPERTRYPKRSAVFLQELFEHLKQRRLDEEVRVDQVRRSTNDRLSILLPPYSLNRIRFGAFSADGSLCPGAQNVRYLQSTFDPQTPRSDNVAFALDSAYMVSPDRGDCTISVELIYPRGCTHALFAMSFTHLMSTGATASVSIEQDISNGHGTDYTVDLNTPSGDTESTAPTLVFSQATWANNKDAEVVGTYTIKLEASFGDNVADGEFFIFDQIVLAVSDERWNKDWETCQ
ncbi:unnamed protein product [Parascedosporium putredinis]|uniref:Glycoside hydrolase family 1 protein n=1 Tax=Parascedosporium putredinis TaxID=1442378 RepID=A0A9P1GZN5_9PEZI|nr:unnamed protein product [Parascedosporium putredinis]CAI7993084.1 unnamed protein product [Parascedosporium putredinis]